MFTNRCSEPFLISRSPSPLYLLSRSEITSARVAPSAETVFSPLVTGRRIVGTDTETLIGKLLVHCPAPDAQRSSLVGCCWWDRNNCDGRERPLVQRRVRPQ